MRAAPSAPKSDAAIGRLPPVSKEVLLPVGSSLYLKRRPNGRQTWVLRTRIGGAWQVRQLGDWPTVGLHLARQRAEAERTGLTPAERDSTVRHALEDFNRLYIAARYRTEVAKKESGAMLDRALAGLASRPLSSLRRADITQAIQRLADRPNTATKTLALVKQFCGWAVAGGLMDTNPMLGVKAGLLGLQGYKPRERVLSVDELRALWLRDDQDAHLLKFVFLTACRIGEALQWSNVQMLDGVWTIPETKSGRTHTLPLSAAALALLPLPPATPYSSLVGRVKRSGVTWTPHDLRRTAATMMREAGVPVSDVEAVLNHAPARLVRVYQRHDPLDAKAAALEALAEQLGKALEAGT